MVKNRPYNRSTEYYSVPTKLHIPIPLCIQKQWRCIALIRAYHDPCNSALLWSFLGGRFETFTQQGSGITENVAVATRNGQLTGS